MFVARWNGVSQIMEHAEMEEPAGHRCVLTMKTNHTNIAQAKMMFVVLLNQIVLMEESAIMEIVIKDIMRMIIIIAQVTRIVACQT